MTLTLQIVAESNRRGEHVFPDYEEDRTWWHGGSAKSPVSYCRMLDRGEEVGRAKVLPSSQSSVGYTTWACPAAGATEIDLIEVRADLRRSGNNYGRQAVQAIGHAYGQPVIAMSLDEASDAFWRSLRWTAHTHPDGDPYRVLFSSA